MVLYSVELVIDSEISNKFIDFMVNFHIPNVMATNCFIRNEILEQEEKFHGKTKFHFNYYCQSLEILHEYREKYSPSLQKEVKDEFGDNFKSSRKIYKMIE